MGDSGEGTLGEDESTDFVVEGERVKKAVVGKAGAGS